MRAPLTLRLDARGWDSREAMWRALLDALGAPAWHGDSLDALFDSLVSGLNRVRPPLLLELVGAAQCPAALVAYLTRVREVFADAGAALGEKAELRFTPAPPRSRPPRARSWR
ncbi:barstar family protein [Sphingomonas sp. BK345]|uniref:barstar family protein n=1 Tax=Sphingomonas sp. BK345 TaxID=2586980 RepID=UPI0016115907|nr:barstar family protein [Sphingomonas sp. BK345]MBB3472801.1 RNAse (barnase) inhibitor barstar [Sphingomonas sp. BK345]